MYATNELSRLDVFQRFHKPGLVISNSIEVKSLPFMPAPINDHPHLAFIGTPGSAWHGVEKLVPLAQAYPDIVIDVIGYDTIEGVAQVPPNLILHGYQVGAACDRILAQADAAIGTAALHRAGLNEASPLKVRDCVSRGIPIILPFIDTDLDDLESDLILKIPNDEDNVLSCSAQIHDFLDRVRGKRIPRELVQGRIDSLAKERQRLDFLARLGPTGRLSWSSMLAELSRAAPGPIHLCLLTCRPLEPGADLEGLSARRGGLEVVFFPPRGGPSPALEAYEAGVSELRTAGVRARVHHPGQDLAETLGSEARP